MWDWMLLQTVFFWGGGGCVKATRTARKWACAVTICVPLVILHPNFLFRVFYCCFSLFFLSAVSEIPMIFSNQNIRIHIIYIYIILPPSNNNKYWGLSILHLTTTTTTTIHNRFPYSELFYLHKILLKRRRLLNFFRSFYSISDTHRHVRIWSKSTID